MARLDDLVERVTDPALRTQLQSAVGELKAKKRFGLVFEEHIPETTAIYGLRPTVGSTVQIRTENGAYYRVAAISDAIVTVEPTAGGETRRVAASDLLVVKRFGEPVFPTLTPLGSVRRAGPDRPAHAVINAENFHALQLLEYVCAGQVDCIYIDPPYNSGARDWRYNNRYVDDNDAWRHSKWLSFMDKRLRIAKRLLKPDGVLIVTSDENEVHHLALLLERLFPDPDFLRYTVTIVYNPKGTYKANFGRVDEQALFVVPNVGHDLINPRPTVSDDRSDEQVAAAHDLIRGLVNLTGRQVPNLRAADGPLTTEQREMLETALDVDPEQLEIHPLDPADARGDVEEVATDLHKRPEGYEDLFLRRRGQESSHRRSRPNQFYAILVDETKRQVVGVGPLLAEDDTYKTTKHDDVLTVYPIDKEGNERVWRYSRETMQRYIDESAIVVGTQHPGDPQPYTLNHRRLKKDFRRLKTVWWDKAHDAGTSGTSLLTKLLGNSQLFPFPKSVYAVRDCLAAVVRNRPDALILDFFAGSGTTFHATCLLNAEDGGHRRSILVTNNEVSEKVAAPLHARHGLWRGDPEFEAHGIFEAVTRPRCVAAVTGTRVDGTLLSGKYRDGLPMANGFNENVEFFRLDYLDPDELELNAQVRELESAVWLGAGAKGDHHHGDASDSRWVMAERATYALLLDESFLRPFVKALRNREDIQIVYFVTDSPEAYVEMCEAVPRQVRTQMLYRDYRQFFRSTTFQSA